MNEISIETVRNIEERIQELVLYTRKPKNEIVSLINDSLKNRNNEWDRLSEISTLDFHKLNQSNIFCLSKWNNEEKYQDIINYINFICKLKKGNVLDFGGGIGDLAILLSKNSIEVDFFELKGKTLDFANWRFKRKYLDINVFSEFEDLEKKYDILVCLDVIEVLEEPESYLDKLLSLVKDKGLFIYSLGQVGHKDHLMNLAKNFDFINNMETYLYEKGFEIDAFKGLYNLKVKVKSPEKD